MAKEKEARRPFNLKKEVKLLPGYIILLLWVIFTIAPSRSASRSSMSRRATRPRPPLPTA